MDTRGLDKNGWGPWIAKLCYFMVGVTNDSAKTLEDTGDGGVSGVRIGLHSRGSAVG